MIKRSFVSFLLLLFLTGSFIYATHNRAGEIIYEHLGGSSSLQYKVTIITFTKTSSVAADRPQLDSVHWGDGTQAVFVRSTFIDLPNDVRKNTYINTHTYPGNGQYLIHYEDPNRNAGVINVPNSVDVPFYVSSLLIINPFQGINNSVKLLQPPIDHGCKNIPYIHNANAYDIDGDSISYVLTVCRGAGGDTIPGYSFPTATNSFTLDPITGDLIWDSPDSAGEYNIAFQIIEWRNGNIVGIVTRDMQVTIEKCINNNKPPIITQMPDTCVLAGTTLTVNVFARDQDGDKISLTTTGGPFQVTNPATFTVTPAFTNDTATGIFTWSTSCNNVREQPYRVEFKAEDNDTLVNLVDLKGFFIRVIAPPPQNPQAVAIANTILLKWDSSLCNQAIGYRIYRRISIYPGNIPCPCDNGAPSYSGYMLIGSTTGFNNTTFLDNNNGTGLVIGTEYCYIITAIFPDGSESCASSQVCASLKKDLPVLTNASVLTTDASTGKIYVAWSKPTELDTIQFPPPYQYKLYHSPDFNGTTFTPVVTLNNINDTTYIDTLINTDIFPFSYRVDLYYDSMGIFVLKGSSTIASSIFLKITPTDNQLNLSWQMNVPWTNTRYDIFRFNSLTLQFDSIASVLQTTYADTGLDNGKTYCYYVRSVGGYIGVDGFIDPIINLSQEECAAPFDNVPPCSPPLTVLPNCTDRSNGLVWTLNSGTCDDDIDHYEIYYTPVRNGNYELIATISDGSVLTFNHDNLVSISGCYKLIAVDSLGNASVDTLPVCVDTCSEYVLPSVFTPDGDQLNDLFHPCDSTTSALLQSLNCPPYRNVRDVIMTIYNRWGTLVFETTNRDINWNGKNLDTGKDCPDGVYFYTCKVNFYTLDGIETRVLTGFVHLIRGKK